MKTTLLYLSGRSSYSRKRWYASSRTTGKCDRLYSQESQAL